MLGAALCVGFVDVAGVSLRALAALEAPEGSTRVTHAVDIDGFEEPGDEPPATLVQFSDADRAARVSLLLLHSRVPPDKALALCSCILDFATACGAKLVVVAAAVRFPPSMESTLRHCVLAYALNGAAAGLRRPTLPDEAQVGDAMCAAFVHVARVEGTPFLALFAPAHKPRPGSDEEAQNAAQLLATALAGVLNVGCGRVTAATTLREDNDAPLMFV